LQNAFQSNAISCNTKQVIQIGIASVAVMVARNRDPDFIAGLIFGGGRATSETCAAFAIFVLRVSGLGFEIERFR